MRGFSYIGRRVFAIITVKTRRLGYVMTVRRADGVIGLHTRARTDSRYVI